MKKLLFILLCFPMIGFGQGWSSYYINANVNHNINANISGNINKTIRTIDYGQLARANAEIEKNRLAKEVFENEKDERASIEIANDPSKAFDYGKIEEVPFSRSFIIKNFPKSGFKSIRTCKIQIPHRFLFSRLANGRYENISDEGVITAMNLNFPYYNKDNTKIVSYKDYKQWENDSLLKATNEFLKPRKSKYENKEDYKRDLERYKAKKPRLKAEDRVQMKHWEVGKEYLHKGDSIFIHKKSITRATICGKPGFVGTIIYEDKYEYIIKDIYRADDLDEGNGIFYFATVTTYGNKNEVTFEQLEGRRYYLKKMIYKTIAGYLTLYYPKY